MLQIHGTLLLNLKKPSSNISPTAGEAFNFVIWASKVDPTLNKVWEESAKRLFLLATVRLQTEARPLVDTTSLNSSGVLDTRDRRITGRQKKGVRASHSAPFIKQALLKKPTSTGVYGLSPQIFLIGERDGEVSRTQKSTNIVVSCSISGAISEIVLIRTTTVYGAYTTEARNIVATEVVVTRPNNPVIRP